MHLGVVGIRRMRVGRPGGCDSTRRTGCSPRTRRRHAGTRECGL